MFTIYAIVSGCNMTSYHPYAIVVRHEQAGLEIEIDTILLGKTQAVSTTGHRADEEYMAALHNHCSDEVLKDAIKGINVDRFASSDGETIIETPRVRRRSPETPSGKPAVTDSRTEASAALEASDVHGLWRLFQCADVRMIASEAKSSGLIAESLTLKERLRTLKKENAKEVDALNNKVNKLEGNLVQLRSKRAKASCTGCTDSKRARHDLTQENKVLKKRVAELEDDRPLFETPAKPAGRLRVPMSVSPASTPTNILDILVAERDKNDKFTLSFTKQLGDTFSQVAGSFNK